MWAKLLVLAVCLSVASAKTYNMITPGVDYAPEDGNFYASSPFVCPTGALTYEYVGTPSRTNPDQAKAACEACYGVTCDDSSYYGEYAGPGYGPPYQDLVQSAVFGYLDHDISGFAPASYSTGPAGRIYQYGHSWTWFGFWWDGITVTVDPISSFEAGACQPVYVRSAGQTIDVNPSAVAPDATCNFYSDAACTTAFTETVTDNDVLFFAQCTRTPYEQFIVTADGVASNAFQVIDHSGTGGQICGDPHFVGYDGTKFLFDGVVGSYYNLFSNQYVSVNTLIASAKNANPYVKGTVNGAVSIRTDAFNMSVNSAAFNKATNTLSFEFNGEMMTIKEKQTLSLDNNCVLLNLEKVGKARHHHHTFTVTNTHFAISIYVAEDHNIYINNTYFDYFISADLSNPTLLGGILGKTAGKYDAVDDIENKQDAFLVDGLYGIGQDGKFLAKSVCTKAKRIDCNVLPNGHSCTSNSNCGSGACDKNGVCNAPGGCLSDGDCSAVGGTVCVSGICAGHCDTSADCAFGSVCSGNFCSGLKRDAPAHADGRCSTQHCN